MPSRRVEVGSKCHVAVESGWTLERRVEEKWVLVVMFWATSVPCGRNRPAGARQVPVVSRGLHGRRGADPPQSRAAWLRRALQAPLGQWCNEANVSFTSPACVASIASVVLSTPHSTPRSWQPKRLQVQHGRTVTCQVITVVTPTVHHRCHCQPSPSCLPPSWPSSDRSILVN